MCPQHTTGNSDGKHGPNLTLKMLKIKNQTANRPVATTRKYTKRKKIELERNNGTELIRERTYGKGTKVNVKGS